MKDLLYGPHIHVGVLYPLVCGVFDIYSSGDIIGTHRLDKQRCICLFSGSPTTKIGFWTLNCAKCEYFDSKRQYPLANKLSTAAHKWPCVVSIFVVVSRHCKKKRSRGWHVLDLLPMLKRQPTQGRMIPRGETMKACCHWLLLGGVSGWCIHLRHNKPSHESNRCQRKLPSNPATNLSAFSEVGGAHASPQRSANKPAPNRLAWGNKFHAVCQSAGPWTHK